MPSESSGSIPRIRTICDGQLQPLVRRSLLRSSAISARWHGLILEEHRADAYYERPNLKSCSNILHVFTGVPVRHEWQIDGRTLRFHSAEGSVVIVPTGFECRVACWRSRPAVQWIIEFDHAVMQQRLEESTGRSKLELVPHLNVSDFQLLRLLQTLHADAVADSPAGSLFGETVGSALALYLAQHYSTGCRGAAQPNGLLGEHSLSRVLDYIHANLSNDLHLKELADIADLSTFHFAKLFKRSTGSSPHQYVLQRRVERVKQLLRNPLMSLTEVSLRAGFADQSHMSNVFRRFVGVTPSSFRGVNKLPRNGA